MKPARLVTVVLIAFVSGAVSWLALRIWVGRGGDPPPLPWTALAGTVALAIAVVAAGLPVRRWQHGRRDRPLDPLVAARTVVFAKAAAYGGAVLIGWYAAQALAVLPDIVGARRTRLLMAALCFLAAVGVAGAGLLVQRWCRLPPDEDEDESGGDHA